MTKRRKKPKRRTVNCEPLIDTMFRQGRLSRSQYLAARTISEVVTMRAGVTRKHDFVDRPDPWSSAMRMHQGLLRRTLLSHAVCIVQLAVPPRLWKRIELFCVRDCSFATLDRRFRTRHGYHGQVIPAVLEKATSMKVWWSPPSAERIT